jgi:hypothetical protein
MSLSLQKLPLSQETLKRKKLERRNVQTNGIAHLDIFFIDFRSPTYRSVGGFFEA